MKVISSFIKSLIVVFFISVSLSCAHINAQSVEKPVLEFVTVVHSDSKPIINWSVNNPDLLNGYRIKRFIYEHPLVVPETYHTIDTIEDPYITTYKDETDIYGEAVPNKRLEKYFVVSYKINGLDTVFNFSDVHQTMFLQTSYEYCEKRNKLIWNKYIGWGDEFDLYEIYCKMNSGIYSLIGSISSHEDTIFYHTNINSGNEYSYYIKALRTDDIESLSNESLISPQSIILPDYLNSDSIIVDHNNNVHLYFELDIYSDLENYELYKSGSGSDFFDFIQKYDGIIMKNIELTDIDFEYNKINYYFLAARDFCDDLVFVSDTMNNIFTEAVVANDERKKNYIEWTDGENNPFYSISRCKEGYCTIIEQNYDKSYTDDIQDIFSGQFSNETSSGQFCYFVESSGEGYLSRSNLVCVNQEEVYYIANSFNPYSDIEENRTFKPKIAFISEYTLIIYGNLGNKIFESNDPDNGWDGKFPDGSLAPRASYLYFISFKNADGKYVRKKSYINLLY